MQRNAKADQINSCQEWLDDKDEKINVENAALLSKESKDGGKEMATTKIRTLRKVIDIADRTPYRKYCKYVVEPIKSE